jgi:hypothetical protein
MSGELSYTVVSGSNREGVSESRGKPPPDHTGGE